MIINMINIISTFYLSKYNSPLDNDRSNELLSAFIKNFESPFVEKIHLFIDDNESLEKLNNIIKKSDKVKIIEVGKKPKYSDFFKYISENLKDDICMITNADIYLYDCPLNLIQLLKDNKNAYALTRHEYDMSHPLIDHFGGSHDCYIFNSKFLNNDLENEDINLHQNLPGIETHIIKYFFDQGFKIFNPCTQIKIVHLHKTNLRNHGPLVSLHIPGDYDFFYKSCWYVPPITIE